IKGKDDNLYTENGAYNTKTDNAYFGKKNLYTQGTKTLKGDSLYYYGKIGYGKAVKNIIFMDSSDKTLLHGQLGEYYKADERVVVTKNAWFAMGTKDSIVVNQKKIPDSLFLGADTLEAQKVFQQKLRLLSKPVVQKDNEIGAEDAKQKELKEKEKAEARKAAAAEKKATQSVSSAATPKKLSRRERKLAEQRELELKKNPPPNKTDSLKTLPDSAKISAKEILTDTISKKSLAKKDSVIVKIDPKAKTNAVKPKSAVGTVKKDSVAVFNPADTVKTRIIKAFHNVRVYKFNLQAKADSLFYTAADSSLRWYKNPILWSNGTQQTGDTIHVFFKNDKIHSFQVLQNGFIVNVEGDSTKFNQVKGKRITGFMSNGELKNVYVDGNAESMYYNKDAKGNYDNLSHTISSRIRFNFHDQELTDIVTIKGIEGAVDPIDKLPKETLLTGFIWKPELRPVSKADIIKGRPKTATKAKPTVPSTKTSQPAKSSTPVQKTPAAPNKAVKN
ncbi:MAG: hypothetical protein REI93_07015, partial [Pedobacter sp.]|nr:hypothetical protein [Pedobacter sp.]